MTTKIQVLSPQPLTSEERAAAFDGVGEIGAAATLYFTLTATHRLHSKNTGSTEAQKVASVSVQYDKISPTSSGVAISLLRLVSLGIKDMEPGLPKPPPFVVMFAIAVANKSLGLSQLMGGTSISAEEFVTTWGLSE